MSAIHGEIIRLEQAEGDDVFLVVYGSEFYARYETQDGYTVIYDPGRGQYCYCDVVEGAFVSTGRPVHKGPPIGLRKHLKEAPAVRGAKFRNRYATLRPEEMRAGPGGLTRTFGPAGGLLEGRRVGTGAVRGLVVLVEFADVQSDVTAGDVEAMLNDLDFTDHGNFCSVRRFYQLMSNGQLDYTNDVIGPIRLSQHRGHYVSTPLFNEALQKALAQHNVDLSRYDSRGEGIIDALTFMYAGRTQYQDWLWPHNSVLNFSQGGLRTNYYTILSMGRSPIDLSIGTFAHESGHMLCRFPDLYDYGNRDDDFADSGGLGRYCLMSAGNHLGGGKVPSPIGAFLRDLAGWTSVVSLNTPDAYELPHGDYARVFRYDTDRSNEYFLVENRSRIGLDAHLPGDGLAVYHCDTLGSNEWQDGTAAKHYQCALLQADGRRDLENNANMGDQHDLFAGVAGPIGATSTPSTRQWDGADSGLLLRDVSPAGSHMTVGVGPSLPVPGGVETVTHVSEPDRLIPDNDRNGISETIQVNAAGALRAIAVEVDISHTYRGDLFIELRSPAGTVVALHETGFDPIDNLNLRIDPGQAPIGDAFDGENPQGTWTLRVADRQGADIGRLDRWALTIELDAVAATSAWDSTPSLDIPDANGVGVTDTIQVDRNGQVNGIAVEVDIAHTYRGDLELELVSPEGISAVLAEQSNDSRDDLKATYTIESKPSLASFVGATAQGDWKLRVRDLANQDTGTLNAWKLTLQL